jgi:hypothetical protein
LMLMLRSLFITREDGLKNDKLEGYWIEEVDGKSRHDETEKAPLTSRRSNVPGWTRGGH